MKHTHMMEFQIGEIVRVKNARGRTAKYNGELGVIIGACVASEQPITFAYNVFFGAPGEINIKGIFTADELELADDE